MVWLIFVGQMAGGAVLIVITIRNVRGYPSWRPGRNAQPVQAPEPAAIPATPVRLAIEPPPTYR